MKEPDVPEADAIEQDQSVEEEELPKAPKIPPDVPEADALDQARSVPLDEEEQDRR
jgi:hypothetical protein